MRPALVVIVLVVALAVVGFLFKDRLFPEEQVAAGAPSTASTPTPSATPSPSVDKEAEAYLDKLTGAPTGPVSAERADHFVTKDQVISLLPEAKIELTTRMEIEKNLELNPNMPITLVREVEQLETTTPEKIIAEAGGDLNKKVRVLDNDQVRESTVREVLQRYAANPDEPITIVKKIQYFELTTPAEIAADASIDPNQELRIITQPYRLEAATVAELLIREGTFSPDSVFYVRTVRPSDTQGIWGIIHDGILTNFAQGMAIRRGKQVNNYKVHIPRLADEMLEDKSSSYLGKLIHRKTLESHVYNFDKSRMGRNPDEIIPGQEIVIINFEPEELVDIYKHFIEERG
jgi:hypothetical protein